MHLTICSETLGLQLNCERQACIKMNYEQWFVLTLKDLWEHLERRTAYHIVRASALLRHLLLDNPKLLDLANRRIRQKIRFRILDTGTWASKRSNNEGFELWTNTICPISPEVSDEDFLREVTLDEFLKIDLFQWKEYYFNVRDVIRLASHIQGGVHHGKPHNNHESIQYDLAHETDIFGQPIYANCLIQIILVVLQSLASLEQIILSSNRDRVEDI